MQGCIDKLNIRMIQKTRIYATKLPMYIFGKVTQRGVLRYIDRQLGPYTNASTSTPVVICNLKWAHSLLEIFFRHYSAMGVTDFVVVGSEKQCEIAAESIAKAKENPGRTVGILSLKSGRPVHRIVSALINNRFRDRWCVIATPEQFLMYPRMGNRKLADFCDFVASERRRHVFSIELDMYMNAYLPAMAPEEPMQHERMALETDAWFVDAG